VPGADFKRYTTRSPTGVIVMNFQRSIERFLLRVVLWLPPLFVLWNLLAPLLLMPVAGWSHWLLTTLFPQAIVGVERQGIHVDILTRFLMAAPTDGAVPAGATGTLTFTLNALKYAYGWPLLLALTLAAPTPWGEKGYRALLGSLILLLVPLWGVVCETLKVLVFNMDPAIAEQIDTTPFTRELLVLAYQLGYLILPPVAPVLLWAAFHRDFLAELLPQWRQKAPNPD